MIAGARRRLSLFPVPDIPCELCGRIPKKPSKHHLIPRTCHSNKWFKKNFSREQMRVTVDLCRECHNAIHRCVPSEKELGRSYNSLDKLRALPGLARHIEWARARRT